MLDSAVRDRNRRLTVPSDNRGRVVNADRLNVNRMTKADRDMVDIRRMRDRGVINNRLGSGTRPF
jgi:hypothetical protein